MQMQTLQGDSKQDKPVGPNTTVASKVSAFSSRVEGNPVGLASAIHLSQESKHSNGVLGRTPGQELVVLPISAVEAGLLPSNQGILRIDIVVFPLQRNTFHGVTACYMVT